MQSRWVIVAVAVFASLAGRSVHAGGITQEGVVQDRGFDFDYGGTFGAGALGAVTQDIAVSIADQPAAIRFDHLDYTSKPLVFPPQTKMLSYNGSLTDFRAVTLQFTLDTFKIHLSSDFVPLHQISGTRFGTDIFPMESPAVHMTGSYTLTGPSSTKTGTFNLDAVDRVNYGAGANASVDVADFPASVELGYPGLLIDSTRQVVDDSVDGMAVQLSIPSIFLPRETESTGTTIYAIPEPSLGIFAMTGSTLMLRRRRSALRRLFHPFTPAVVSLPHSGHTPLVLPVRL